MRRNVLILVSSASLAAGLVAFAQPAQATASGIEVSVAGSVVTVKGHPGGGPGDITISRSSAQVTVSVDPESDGVAQIWSTDSDCLPATGVDGMQVTCTVPAATSTSTTLIVDMKDSTIDGAERIFLVNRLTTTFYGGPLGDHFEMLNGYPAQMFGEGGDDYLIGNDEDDVINGGPGSDYIEGGGGRDRISSGAGWDEVDVEDGRPDTVDCGDVVGSADDPDTVMHDPSGDVFTNCINYVTLSSPVNTALPTISARPQVGVAVTGSVGTWSGGGTMAYQTRWLSCPNLKPSPKVPTDCQTVVNWSSQASAQTFRPRTSDVGRLLVFGVRATNERGSSEAMSALSASVLAAAPPTKPVNTVKPSVPTPVLVGSTVTGDRGQWTGENLTFLFSWRLCDQPSTALERCTRPAGSQNLDSYQPAVADKGKYIRFVVTVSNSAGATTVSSDPQLVERYTVPGAPTNFDWTQRSTTQIELSWDPPTDQGGRPVTEYRLEYWRFDNWNYNSLKEFRFIVSTNQRSYPVEVESSAGLGSQYWFRVAAVNSIGIGEWSNLYPVSTLPPPPPDEIRTQRTAANKAKVRWRQASYSSPSKDALIESAGRDGILRWEMEYRTRPYVFSTAPVVDVEPWSEWQSLGYVTSTDQDISPLSLSTTYQFRVRAENQSGWGEWTVSGDLNIDSRVPSSPVRNVRVSDVVSPAGDRFLVSWKPPADFGGAAVLGYMVRVTPGSSSCTPSTLANGPKNQCWVEGLKAGEAYSITIEAQCCEGVSSFTSVPGTFSPFGVPAAPTVVGDPDYGRKGKLATATITWAWPKKLGGATDYSMQVMESAGLSNQGARTYRVLREFARSEDRAVITNLEFGKRKFIYLRVKTPLTVGEVVSVELLPPRG